MKILVFTEGTLTIHRTWAGLPREEMVRCVKEGRAPKDYASSIPISRAVEKLHAWKRQGAEIMYLTSRTSAQEIQDVQSVLRQFDFPEGTLYFRREGETYAQVAERVMPDMIIEDDCESIGGEVEMTYPHIRPDLSARIKSVVVKEEVTRLLEGFFLYVPPLMCLRKTRCVPPYTGTLRTDYRVPATVL